MFVRIYNFLKPAIIPFGLALISAIIILVSYKFSFVPSAEKIAEFAGEQYGRYGLLAVALAGVIEGIFMLGLYFPGSFILIAVVMVAPKTFPALFSIGLVALATFSATNALNYALGKYGFYKIFLAMGGQKQLERMRRVFRKWGSLAIFVTAIIPSYLAVTQICTGIARERFWKVWPIAIASLAFWITVVTVTVATISLKFSASSTGGALDWIITGALVLWGIYNIARVQIKKHRGEAPCATLSSPADTHRSEPPRTGEPL